jgi:hypothetical protein
MVPLLPNRRFYGGKRHLANKSVQWEQICRQCGSDVPSEHIGVSLQSGVIPLNAGVCFVQYRDCKYDCRHYNQCAVQTIGDNVIGVTAATDTIVSRLFLDN